MKRDPDHFLATFHLMLTDEAPFEPAYFEKVWQLYDEAKKGWKSENYLDWGCWEARPYLTALNYVVTYFYGEGFLGMAEQVVDVVLSKRPEGLAPDFLHLALSLYNELGRFAKLESLYNRYLPLLPQNKDSLLIHLALSKLLQGLPAEAKRIFGLLIQVNPEAADFFADASWLDELLEAENLEFYAPCSNESLVATMYHLQEFLERNILVTEFLAQFARDYGGKSEASDLFDFWEGYQTPFFAGLRFDIYRTLFHENLRTAEDFQQLTEKEFLAIKGIGKKTLERLKENGAIFKEG